MAFCLSQRIPQIPKARSLRPKSMIFSAMTITRRFIQDVEVVRTACRHLLFDIDEHRWHTSVLMLAENVSFGVLALPQALAVLGLVPGLLCLFFLGVIATYTGWIISEFKLAHPSVHSFADCGMLIAGPIGREIMAVSQVFILIFMMGAHVLSFSIAMNAITEHAMCTVAWLRRWPSDLLRDGPTEDVQECQLHVDIL